MGLTSALLILGLIASGVYGNQTQPNGRYSDDLIHYKKGDNSGIHIDDVSEEDNYHHGSRFDNIGEEDRYHHGSRFDNIGEEDRYHHGSRFDNVGEEEIYNHANHAEHFYKTEGKNYIFVTFPDNGYLNNNGHSLMVSDGRLQLVDEGLTYEIVPRAYKINQNETLNFNGKQATIEYIRSEVIIEFPDKNVIAYMGGHIFMGDRESFNHHKELLKLPNRDIMIYLERNKHKNTNSGAIMQTALTRYTALNIGLIHICIILYYSNVFTKVF